MKLEDTIIPFGRSKGKTFSQVPRRVIEYLANMRPRTEFARQTQSKAQSYLNAQETSPHAMPIPMDIAGYCLSCQEPISDQDYIFRLKINHQPHEKDQIHYLLIHVGCYNKLPAELSKKSL
jgi:hypothetical protein